MTVKTKIRCLYGTLFILLVTLFFAAEADSQVVNIEAKSINQGMIYR